MNSSEKIDLLASALVKLQGELPIIKKSAHSFKNKYAKLEEFIKAAQPLLLKHGLSVIFGCIQIENQLFLRGTLLHTSGQWMVELFPIIANESTSQEYGAANTYSRRYLFSNLIGIVAEGEDDDQQRQYKLRDPNKPISEAQYKKLLIHLKNNPDALHTIVQEFDINDLRDMTMGQFQRALEIAEG